jgi:hypothetical protein
MEHISDKIQRLQKKSVEKKRKQKSEKPENCDWINAYEDYEYYEGDELENHIRVTLDLQGVELPKPRPLQLPVWPEATRGIPSSMLRCALFGIIKPGNRKNYKDHELVSSDGIKITFTGQQLDQADLDVWEQVLHLARKDSLSTPVVFKPGFFLKQIGRNQGGADTKWLYSSLKRLAGAVIEVVNGKKSYFGAMIQEGGKDDDENIYCVKINPKIAKLYGWDGFTLIDWSHRSNLKKPLAKWLHGFYSSHDDNPLYAYSVKTIHKLCGSSSTDLKSFKQILKLSLTELSVATGWTCLIDDTDIVRIKK